MTPADLSRLRRWVGLPDSYLNFDPVGIEGDAQTLVEKMLVEGWAVRVAKEGPHHVCTVEHAFSPSCVDGISSSARSRREAICLAALGVCS
jgi:hypothetical protein